MKVAVYLGVAQAPGFRQSLLRPARFLKPCRSSKSSNNALIPNAHANRNRLNKFKITFTEKRFGVTLNFRQGKTTNDHRPTTNNQQPTTNNQQPQ
jgi:hypothetical protein